MDLSKLRKEICLGRLIWIQPPSIGSAVFFTKKLMNSLGVQDREMIYLTAHQFIRYSNSGFSQELFKTARMLLIGDIENLSDQSRTELLVKLSHHKKYKHSLDINLVLVSPYFSEIKDLIQERLKPRFLNLFANDHPIGINEKIHDFIESASVEYGKPVWRLSIKAAESLEAIFHKKSEEYLKQLIFEAVRYSKNKLLSKKDVDASQQNMASLIF